MLFSHKIVKITFQIVAKLWSQSRTDKYALFILCAIYISICYIYIFKFRYRIYFMQCSRCGSTRCRSHSNYIHKKSGEKVNRYLCKDCNKTFSDKVRKFRYADKERFLALYLNYKCRYQEVCKIALL